MYALLLLDFNGPYGGPHGGPGFFPGFFFCGPVLFWTLLLGFIVVRTISRQSARRFAPQPARPAADGPHDAQPWPNLDPTPPAPRKAEGDKQDDDKGKIEYF
jgi:hypothetical protein